jgi:hypothetical protein
MTVHTQSFELAFAEHKQADIETALTITEIVHNLPFRGFVPMTMDKRVVITDAAQYKGHSKPTFNKVLQQDYPLASRGYDMTQLSAVIFPYFVLGSRAATQPDVTNAPTVYDQKLTFQAETNVNAIPTSMIELYDAQRLLTGVYINSFQLMASKDDHAVLNWEGFAREFAINADTMPALAASQQFFKLLNATFTFGAGAGSDVSANVEDFNITVSQNLNRRHNPGNTAGDEKLLSVVHMGQQRVSGSLAVYADTTLRNLFLNHTECVLTVVLDSGVAIEGGLNYQVTVSIPNFYISDESHADDAQTGILTLNFNDESVMQATGEDFFALTVRTNSAHANLGTTP